ncbi:MAG TPA: CooT family nickel-binding protein [Dehalococcoidia bacterium]|nr:CooT family nickel-binding protein [Dehalococcoidia bacterium]
MCLSKVYFDRDGQKEIVLEEVASIVATGGKLQLKTLFGEQKVIDAHIKEVDLLAHSVLLEEPGVNNT